jgi:hypothetical protein
MTVLFIAIALSILSLALLFGFDFCIGLPSDTAGAKTSRHSGRRIGEDIMG